jgi:uncharacterized protein YlxW (UPF0749 family)
MTAPPRRSGPSDGGIDHRPNFLLELFSNPLDPGYADAAAARAADGPRRPWARRTAFSLRAVALALTGFLFTVAWQQAIAAEPDRTSAHAGLVTEVKDGQALIDELQGRSDQLRADVNRQQRTALGGSNAELQRIEQQEATTGLAPVTGPGATVHLEDAKPPIDPTTGKATTGDVSRVLDVDLQHVVNGLWAAGAEAVAINGQRLTATATIRTAGSAVLVDFRPVTSPYDVAAIGPPDLADRFATSATAAAMRGLADQYGLGFSIRRDSELNLPAAANPSLQYAHKGSGS